MTEQSHRRADPEAIARLLLDEAGNAPKGLPPIHRWNPPYCGEIDMRIRANGEWIHEGDPIRRPGLVRLFSTVLRREDDDHYYLVTPVEKVRITVDDAPLLAIRADRVEEAGVPYLRFTTRTDDIVVADEAHPLRVEYSDAGEPRPYLRVRDRLDALLHRNVYYQLVEWAEEVELDGRRCHAVQSAGKWFEIAPAD